MQPRVAIGRIVLARDDARKGVEVRRSASDRVAPVAPRKASVTDRGRTLAREKGLVLGGFAVLGGLRCEAAAAARASGVAGVVVETLGYEDYVGEAKVAAESNGRGCEVRCECAWWCEKS